MEKYLTLNQIGESLGLSKSAMFAMIRRGDMPQGVKIGGKTRRWRASEIDTWLADKELKA